MEGLRELLLMVEFSLSDAEVERLFAMTDLDGNGRVTLHEWEDAWSDLVDEARTRAGASKLAPAPALALNPN